MFAHVHFLFVRGERIVTSIAQRLQFQIGFDRVETIDGQGFLRHVIDVVLVQFDDDQTMLDQQLVAVHDVFIDEDQCTVQILHGVLQHLHCNATKTSFQTRTLRQGSPNWETICRKRLSMDKQWHVSLTKIANRRRIS